MSKITPACTFHPLTYLSGVHNQNVCRAAVRRRDIGLLVTPLVPHYVEIAAEYPVVGIDNGVFSISRPFCPKKFVKLLDRADRWKKKVRFAVAPDVVGDAAATLQKFPYWSELIRERGFPVAFVGQDGLEHLQEQIPWEGFDVFFIGGSTDWKLGRLPDARPWQLLMREMAERNIPIHMGRVNSYERLELAGYELNVSTVDGTCLAFAPTRNLQDLESWLTLYNKCGHWMARRQELGYSDPADLDWYQFGRAETIKWEKRCYGWSETELGWAEPDTNHLMETVHAENIINLFAAEIVGDRPAAQGSPHLPRTVQHPGQAA